MRLVMDTSTSALSLSLTHQDELVATTLLNGKRQHGEVLVSSVSELLSQVGRTPHDVTELVVGIGPGSYTGLRVGVTFAKTWATSVGTPLYQVSSLALIATQTARMQLPSTTLVVPVMDARRMTAYTGAYYWDETGRLHNLLSDCHTEWHTWIERLQQTSYQSVVLVGHHLAPFAEMLSNALPHLRLTCLEGMNAHPDTTTTHLVSLELVTAPSELTPNYAHATLAEQEWLSKHEGVQQDEVVEYLA